MILRRRLGPRSGADIWRRCGDVISRYSTPYIPRRCRRQRPAGRLRCNASAGFQNVAGDGQLVGRGASIFGGAVQPARRDGPARCRRPRLVAEGSGWQFVTTYDAPGCSWLSDKQYLSEVTDFSAQISENERVDGQDSRFANPLSPSGGTFGHPCPKTLPQMLSPAAPKRSTPLPLEDVAECRRDCQHPIVSVQVAPVPIGIARGRPSRHIQSAI